MTDFQGLQLCIKSMIQLDCKYIIIYTIFYIAIYLVSSYYKMTVATCSRTRNAQYDYTRSGVGKFFRAWAG